MVGPGRIAAADDLLVGDGRAPEAGGQVLPLVLGDLGGLLHVDHVVLARHDLAHLVEAAGHDHRAVLVSPLAFTGEVAGLGGDEDVGLEGDESALQERLPGLSHEKAAKAGILEGKEVELLKSGPALAGAGRAGQEHLGVAAVKEGLGPAPGSVGLLGLPSWAGAFHQMSSRIEADVALLARAPASRFFLSLAGETEQANEAVEGLPGAAYSPCPPPGGRRGSYSWRWPWPGAPPRSPCCSSLMRSRARAI